MRALFIVLVIDMLVIAKVMITIIVNSLPYCLLTFVRRELVGTKYYAFRPDVYRFLYKSKSLISGQREYFKFIRE